MSSIDLAYGAFAGVLVGDASGAPLEFYQGKISKELVNQAMHMPGGGIWKVGPGQITDDGELSLSLGYALMKNDPYLGFPQKDVYQSYRQWFESSPFDIGRTCQLAFSCDYPNFEQLERSKANGALMRIISLPIWTRDLPQEIISEYARQDALLSHPNSTTQEVNVIYSLAIAYLLNHRGDNKGCYKYLKKYVDDNIDSEVKEWFLTAKREKSVIKENIGYVKWAFQMAIYHLKAGTHYEEAIKMTLLRGGDIDTNAGIVGGMIGALYGIEDIPQYMLDPVLTFNPAKPKGGQKRPAKYRAVNFFKIVDTFYQNFKEI